MKCIHLIPVDGVGGVEAAARSYLNDEQRDAALELQVMYVATPSNLPPKTERCIPERTIDSPFASVNNPAAYLWAFAKLMREKPEVLICSLWRTMPVGVLVKLLRPRTKLVCFLHNTISLHLLDKLCNGLAMCFSYAIWSDSDSTLQRRIPGFLKRGRKLRIISFLLEKHRQERLPKNAPSFVYWGRLHYQKGIDRALRLIATLAKQHPATRFYIFGPDNGEEEKLRELCRELGIEGLVEFMGVTSFRELKENPCRFSYYLQLSRFEGMAVSVVEAMQLGLVPVVTPVGEIANYCHAGNAIMVPDPDKPQASLDRLSRALQDDRLYAELQRNTVQAWNAAVPYGEDIRLALIELAQS